MDALLHLIQGFESALTWWNLLYCLIGVSIGMFVGVLPGLGPVASTAILIPLTFGMEPVSAIIMISGIFYRAMYGGTITSVLINTPGEAASVITCIDGHQMAKQGRAGVALGVAAIGSFVGGIFSILCLAFIGPPLASCAEVWTTRILCDSDAGHVDACGVDGKIAGPRNDRGSHRFDSRDDWDGPHDRCHPLHFWTAEVVGRH